jgi:hypothetical protein
MTYPAQVHASDVYIRQSDSDADKKPFLDGMALFEQALDVWLPCFKQSSSNNNNNNVAGALGER